MRGLGHEQQCPLILSNILDMHTKQGRLQLEFNQDPKKIFCGETKSIEMTKGQEISERKYEVVALPKI